jgi:hypothetical protein
VISANGLLSSLWVSQHKDESNPFLFATKIYPSRNFRTKPTVKNEFMNPPWTSCRHLVAPEIQRSMSAA